MISGDGLLVLIRAHYKSLAFALSLARRGHARTLEMPIRSTPAVNLFKDAGIKAD
jgi:hypothetical protein